MSVNTLTFQQSSAVLNDLVKQATGRSAVINTEADFISVAQTALTLGKDVIFNELSNVLARTIFAIRPYSASMRGLEKTFRSGEHICGSLTLWRATGKTMMPTSIP